MFRIYRKPKRRVKMKEINNKELFGETEGCYFCTDKIE